MKPLNPAEQTEPGEHNTQSKPAGDLGRRWNAFLGNFSPCRWNSDRQKYKHKGKDCSTTQRQEVSNTNRPAKTNLEWKWSWERALKALSQRSITWQKRTETRRWVRQSKHISVLRCKTVSAETARGHMCTHAYWTVCMYTLKRNKHAKLTLSETSVIKIIDGLSNPNSK